MTSQKLAAVAAAGSLAAHGMTLAASYTLTNVGAAVPAAASGSTATHVNASGQVAGFYTNGTGADTTVTPFVYANGVVTSLDGTYGSPTAFNAGGAMSLGQGGLYRPGVGVTAVPTGNGAISITSARGINDSGLVVGAQRFLFTSPVTGNTYTANRPYVYDPATNVTTDLGNTAFGDRGDYPSTAEAINTAGHIVGTIGSMPAGATYSSASAFLATPNGSGGYAFLNVGASVKAAYADAFNSNATGVNDTDSVIGTYGTDNGTEAFIYANGVATRLGDFNSGVPYSMTTPNAINNSNVVVGTSTFFRDENYKRTDHAFIWQNGTFSDLNNLIVTGTGFVLNNATDINDSGQITGAGTYNGQTTAFLLNLIGPLYYQGGLGGGLTNAVGASTNFATNASGTAVSSALPTATNDLIFATTNATNLSTTLAGNLTINSVTFGGGANASSAVTVGGSGTLTLTAAGSNTVASGVGLIVRSGSAAVTFNANLALGASQSWTNNSTSALAVGGNVALNANTLTFAGTGIQSIGGAITGTGGLTNTASGTVTLTGANTYTGATVMNSAGGTLRVGPAARPAALGGVGTDLTNGRIQFDYTGASPLSAIRSLLAASYANNGFNNGTVLRSSTATASRGLGFTDTGSSVIVVSTLYGDANLDGRVDFNDFLVLQNNFGKAATRFDQGNFNYDNATDFNDFLVLQNNFGKSTGGGSVAFSSEQVAAMTAWSASVPEPSAVLSIVGSAGIGLRRRRRA